MFNVNHYANLNIKGLTLLELQITQTRHPLSILQTNISKFKTHKKEKNHEMCTKLKVHIFYVRTIIMESLNIKE